MTNDEAQTEADKNSVKGETKTFDDGKEGAPASSTATVFDEDEDDEDNILKDAKENDDADAADDDDDDATETMGEESIAAVSDLSDLQRRICVVTTAGLPWRTGTAVNPLARALYLTRGRPKGYVTLMIPWLETKEEQAKVYGQTTFDSLEEQEAFVRKYSKERVDCEAEAANLKIAFYPALYHDLFGSIFATVDICALIPKEEADIAILEEPEHLNWFRVVPSLDESVGKKDAQEQALIGWTAKFSYVVGILHTNYSAYMRQYGLGASIVTASALQALSSVVVRAYTHRLIRLSGTLPELDKAKEVTCNVHGVRSEFFQPPMVQEACETKNDAYDSSGNMEEEFEPQPIYFIGKVIWAKGFDKLLEIEDLYRKECGEYFPIDVYGSGGDSAAVTRAFLGRSGLSRKFSSSDSLSTSNNSTRQEKTIDATVEDVTPKDQTAALLFSREGNLRGQVEEGQEIPNDTLVVEVQNVETPTNTPRSPTSAASSSSNPDGVISHLSGKTLETGTNVSRAIFALSERLAKLGHRMAFTEECRDGGSNVSATPGGNEATKFVFDPPKTRYELRRHPIPARFLGVKDHALLRDIPGHKIFINCSITEVLCTTTAEALAMGRFVIIPNHREYSTAAPSSQCTFPFYHILPFQLSYTAASNEFFLQFPNCLAYATKKECAEKVKWALEHNPEPLSSDDKFKLMWEGANERLYTSCAMTETEAEERNKRSSDYAKLHMDTMKTGSFFASFLGGKKKQDLLMDV